MENTKRNHDVTLVFMAAGLGKRFGGNKQLAALGPKGQSLMAYTAFDAYMIGYSRIIFILREEMVKEFMDTLGYDLRKVIPWEIVIQDNDKIPQGIHIPEEREKPLGTGHALYCSKDRITGSFVILNADDHYGRGVLKNLFDALVEGESIVIPGYPVAKTLSNKGTVSRGVLDVDEKGYLLSIKEREKIWKENEQYFTFSQDGIISLKEDTLVSMNIWGMQKEILHDLEEVFRSFLQKDGRDLLKDEFYLPEAMDTLRKRNGTDIKIIPAMDKWMGVTYAEDGPEVASQLKEMVDGNLYPLSLFGE